MGSSCSTATNGLVKILCLLKYYRRAQSPSAVQEVSKNEKKNLKRNLDWDLNPGLLGDKRKHYHCAMLPPLPKLKEEGWALQPAAVNIKLGTTNAHRNGVALQVQGSDIISPIQYLTNLKIVAELICHPGIFSAGCVCYLFLKWPTLFY